MPQLNQTLGSILIRKWELINQKAKTNAITCFCPLIKTVNWRITKADGGLIERVTWTIHSKFIFIVYDGPLPVVFPFFLILFQIFQIFFFIFFFKVSFNFLGRRSVPENPSVVYYLFIFFLCVTVDSILFRFIFILKSGGKYVSLLFFSNLFSRRSKSMRTRFFIPNRFRVAI